MLSSTPAGAPWGLQPPPRLTPHHCRCLPTHHQGCLQYNMSSLLGVQGRKRPLKVKVLMLAVHPVVTALKNSICAGN